MERTMYVEDKLRADVGTENSKGSVIERSGWFSTLGSNFTSTTQKIGPQTVAAAAITVEWLNWWRRQTLWTKHHTLANFLSSPSKNRLRSTKYLYNLSMNQDFGFWYLHRPLICPKNLSPDINLFFLYRYGHNIMLTLDDQPLTHTFGGLIWIILFFLERYGKNSWDDCFGFFDFCVLWRLGPKTVFLGPLA